MGSSRVAGFRIAAAAAICLAVIAAWPVAPAPAAEEDLDTALMLANLLRAARSVISSNQTLINDPNVADKGLSGDVVVAKTAAQFTKQTGTDPGTIDPQSRLGRLIGAELDAIRQVMDENQDTINEPGVGFKGFVPAVFARRVTEAFQSRAGEEVDIKVTAPPELVRNRKARPDALETQVIREKFMTPAWPQDQVFSTHAERDGRSAYRVMVPEYYTAGCLSCHGEPKGEIDITGYPKEGGKLGDLGGVISITLYR
jgi:hypothetical protein